MVGGFSKLLNWLKDIVPTGLVFVMAVYGYMKRKLFREQVKRKKVELEKDYLENEKSVEKKYDNTDDVDIVRDAIREGRRGDSGS